MTIKLSKVQLLFAVWHDDKFIKRCILKLVLIKKSVEYIVHIARRIYRVHNTYRVSAFPVHRHISENPGIYTRKNISASAKKKNSNAEINHTHSQTAKPSYNLKRYVYIYSDSKGRQRGQSVVFLIIYKWRKKKKINK